MHTHIPKKTECAWERKTEYSLRAKVEPEEKRRTNREDAFTCNHWDFEDSKLSSAESEPASSLLRIFLEVKKLEKM
jgi:hypothetical protein